MSVHTPGPWIVREWTCHAPTTIGVEIDGRFAPIADTQDAAGYRMKPEAYANARLIAAAPEMLEVLRAVAKHFADTDAPLGSAARACIDKATLISNVSEDK